MPYRVAAWATVIRGATRPPQTGQPSGASPRFVDVGVMPEGQADGPGHARDARGAGPGITARSPAAIFRAARHGPTPRAVNPVRRCEPERRNPAPAASNPIPHGLPPRHAEAQGIALAREPDLQGSSRGGPAAGLMSR
jgi:hypothetical protein